MGTKQTPDERWDREQWANDAPDEARDEGGAVWNRRQMEVDNTGTPREGTGREANPADLAGVAETESADTEHISGRGQPSGESHWDRTEDSNAG